MSNKNTKYIHINCLEFVILILQLATAITRLEDKSPTQQTLRDSFPHGIPAIPTILMWTDNTPSKKWANKVSTASPKGQHLIRVYAKLLSQYNLGTNCDWIKGSENNDADAISRPNPLLSDRKHCQQIFQQIPATQSCNYFRPDQELTSLLASRLLCDAWLDQPVLPKRLGQFKAT